MWTLIVMMHMSASAPAQEVRFSGLTESQCRSMADAELNTWPTWRVESAICTRTDSK